MGVVGGWASGWVGGQRGEGRALEVHGQMPPRRPPPLTLGVKVVSNLPSLGRHLCAARHGDDARLHAQQRVQHVPAAKGVCVCLCCVRRGTGREACRQAWCGGRAARQTAQLRACKRGHAGTHPSSMAPIHWRLPTNDCCLSPMETSVCWISLRAGKACGGRASGWARVGGWGTRPGAPKEASTTRHTPVGGHRARGVVLPAKPRADGLEGAVGAPPPAVVKLVLWVGGWTGGWVGG